MIYYDIHTHQPSLYPEVRSIVAADYSEELSPNFCYSAAIHPWQSDENLSFERIRTLAQEPNVIAIGETGMHKGRGADIALQKILFEEHILLAMELNKPLIIHCVNAYGDLFRINNRHRPTVKRIIHGFQGPKMLAGQLIKEGFYLSFGMRFKWDAAQLAWSEDRLFVETDESYHDIRNIYASIASILSVEETVLVERIEKRMDDWGLAELFPVRH